MGWEKLIEHLKRERSWMRKGEQGYNSQKEQAEDESPERASCLPDDTQLAKQRNGYQVEIPAWAPKLPFLVLAQVVGIIIRAKRVGWSEFKSFPVVCQPCEFMSLP